jgi:hypothetical protein
VMADWGTATPARKFRARHHATRARQNPSRSTRMPGKIAKAIVTGKIMKTNGLCQSFTR